MSESVDFDVDVVPQGLGLRQVLASLLVLGLVGGAWLLSAGGQNAPYPNAGEYVADLHAQGGAALSAALPDEVYDFFGIPEEGRSTSFDGAPTNIVVQSENVIEIKGVPLVEVVTDSGTWCVRPDGMLLFDCLYGAWSMTTPEPGWEVQSFDTQFQPIDQALLGLREPVAALLLLGDPAGEVRELTGTAELRDPSLIWTLVGVNPVVVGQLGEFTESGVAFGGENQLAIQMDGTLGPDLIMATSPIEIVYGNETITLIPQATYWLK